MPDKLTKKTDRSVSASIRADKKAGRSGKEIRKKKEKVNLTTEIKKLVSELLSKLEVEAKVEVTQEAESAEKEDKAAGEHYKINIETTESGLLIGRHGETINGLQLLIGVILYKKLGKWVRVVVDIGDYRKMREESIREMVNRIISEVEQTGQPVTLPYLSPLERRIVHLICSENEKVMSESSGDGRDRRVTVKPR